MRLIMIWCMPSPELWEVASRFFLGLVTRCRAKGRRNLGNRALRMKGNESARLLNRI